MVAADAAKIGDLVERKCVPPVLGLLNVGTPREAPVQLVLHVRFA
jgi:hypothetical protein